jgi:hypothetical protein
LMMLAIVLIRSKQRAENTCRQGNHHTGAKVQGRR